MLPLGLPNLAAVESGTVEVRASQRIELRFGEVLRRPELTGRRERIEIRCVNKRVVAARERGLVRGRDSKGKKATSHLWACDPMKADVNYDQLSFGPALEHRRHVVVTVTVEYRQQRIRG